MAGPASTGARRARASRDPKLAETFARHSARLAEPIQAHADRSRGPGTLTQEERTMDITVSFDADEQEQIATAFENIGTPSPHERARIDAMPDPRAKLTAKLEWLIDYAAR